MKKLLLSAVASTALLALLPTASHAVAPKIAVGSDYMMLMKADGTVWSWGWNAGELGIGNRTTQYTPVQVPGMTGVVDISVSQYGNGFSMALKADGTVWVWGNLSDGRAAYPTSGGEYKNSPYQIPQLRNIVSIGNSGTAMFAVDAEGAVWSWGGPGYAALGDGPSAKTQKSTPAKIAGLTGVTRISRGSDSVVALKADGTSVGWGYDGALIPNASTSTNIAPIAIPVPQLKYLEGIGSNTSGAFMGIDMNGDVLSWGDTNSGVYSCNQPRGGATTRPYFPTGLTTASTKMKQIAGGSGFVLFLNEIGVVKSCGGNNYGQLGDGSTKSTTPDAYTNDPAKPGPVLVSGLPADVSFIAAGGYASAAISATGAVYTWGRGDNGYAGVLNSAAKNLTPIKVDVEAGTPIATFSGTQTGALSEATLDIGIAVAPEHVGREGDIYVALVFPSGQISVLTPQGIQALGATSIAPFIHGVLPKSLPMSLITAPTDLRALAGLSIVVGYGLGIGAAANNDLLTGTNRLGLVLTLK